jgi:hypothetical protein
MERPTQTNGHVRRLILLGSLDSKIASNPKITPIMPPIALNTNESQNVNDDRFMIPSYHPLSIFAELLASGTFGH